MLFVLLVLLVFDNTIIAHDALPINKDMDGQQIGSFTMVLLEFSFLALAAAATLSITSTVVFDKERAHSRNGIAIGNRLFPFAVVAVTFALPSPSLS